MNSTTHGALLLATPLLVLASATAQGDADETKKLEQQYKTEIAFPYVKKGRWNLDWDDVRTQASATGKLIFACFTRSDIYSIPCKDLQDRLLSDLRIPDFAETVVPFLHVMTKIPGRKYDDLHTRLGFTEYPTLCLMNAKGEVLYVLRISDMTIDGFHNRRDDIQKTLDLDDTDPEEGKELLFLRFRLRNIDFAEAARRGAKLKFTKQELVEYQEQLVETMMRLSLADAQEILASADLTKTQKKRATEIVTDLEIEEAMAPLMRGFKPGEVPPYHICYDLFQEGKTPSGKTDARAMFWTSVANVACDKADTKALSRALHEVRQGIGATNPAYLAILERRLAELKKQQERQEAKEKRESGKAGPGKD